MNDMHKRIDKETYKHLQVLQSQFQCDRLLSISLRQLSGSTASSSLATAELLERNDD